MRKVIAKKSQEEIDLEEDRKNTAMRDFGFECTDHIWNPFFLPEWNGYYSNPFCLMSWADFLSKFRDHWMKTN